MKLPFQNRDATTQTVTGRRPGIGFAARWIRTALIVAVVTLFLVCSGTELFLRYVTLADRHSAIQTPEISGLADVQSSTFSTWRLLPNLKDVVLKTYIVNNATAKLPRSFVLSTNEAGYRGPPLQPAGSRVRILALGDSTTFGLCVNDQETWPAQLQALLNANAGLEKYEVVNGGVTGYTIYQALRRIDEWLALKPSVVILTSGNNEWDSWEGISDIERYGLTDPLEPGSRGLRLPSLVRWRMLQSTRKGDGRPRLNCAEYAECLKKMTTLFTQNGIRVICVLWPQAFQIENKQPQPVHYQDSLRQFCGAERVPLVDLMGPFLASGETLYCDTVHTNTRGCALVAVSLAQRLHALEAAAS